MEDGKSVFPNVDPKRLENLARRYGVKVVEIDNEKERMKFTFDAVNHRTCVTVTFDQKAEVSVKTFYFYEGVAGYDAKIAEIKEMSKSEAVDLIKEFHDNNNLMRGISWDDVVDRDSLYYETWLDNHASLPYKTINTWKAFQLEIMSLFELVVESMEKREAKLTLRIDKLLEKIGVDKHDTNIFELSEGKIKLDGITVKLHQNYLSCLKLDNATDEELELLAPVLAVIHKARKEKAEKEKEELEREEREIAKRELEQEIAIAQ